MATVTVHGPVDPGKVSADKRPTSRQAWCAARLAFELLGLEWPESRRDMSAAIGRLQVATAEASTVTAADAEIPF